ncbi:MAG: ATP synthase subunit A [Candidatus Methanoliparum thermophilum]|uniref:A-type ATP synthase subunit A n=1 Tax=Methanoliparum thermophilum TaxID=2491083 RepID=A0A520KQM0_METT2|nr:ATP synthase subunit A [Candidatus Methanoliparum sp. LAM-1]RZN63862.1 MAG: ATP synthase subunit A [Candidatus Methanoliparum thermophilum]BDC36412.1 ATP synthase subunit A [Candidatus Methanoliparum sp. LAM-1]
MVLKGKIIKVAGPLVVAEGMKGSAMYEVVRVGEDKLLGENIGLNGDQASIQVYEDTSGIKPGENVFGTGSPLSVLLGPGLLTNIYDGVQRPLPEIFNIAGEFIKRGLDVPALDKNKKWDFVPSVKKGEKVKAGDIIGTVDETKVVKHRILIPPNVNGLLKEINGGKFTINEPIGIVEQDKKDVEIYLAHSWPVRMARPYITKIEPNEPMFTGQRVLDTFFPVTKGGTAAIPGGFGTGKTVTQHQLARWSDADIIVYIGCGERGNEMTEVLRDFPKLIDPKSGEPLMQRTVLIANTSNMPVAAREASVYTGITIAEYYRDMGYNVALMADSTSRWAEALREISGRMEEMPGEEGYPAYLASRIAGFYERAGRVTTLCGKEGTISVIGAVSPPGGDFSEPVTQNTLRITKVFWALDSSLADRRHFPAINWLRSYSLYSENLSKWFNNNIAEDFTDNRKNAMKLLQQESELQEIVQLVGPDALPERERVVLETARIIREDFLQQNAYHDIDTYCDIKKQYRMLKIILKFHKYALDAVNRGIKIRKITEMPILDEIARMKYIPLEEFDKRADEIVNEIDLVSKEIE